MRDRDAVDAGRVADWLRQARPELAPGAAELRQFPGGASNLTFELHVGGRALILRRPPFGPKPKAGHDMAREYRVLSQLHCHFPVPAPIAYCADETVIGAPFYLMEKVVGAILRRDPPASARWSEDTARALCTNLFDALVQLHALDPASVGLGDLGKPVGYVGRQVAGWCDRYRHARTDDVPDAEALMTWLSGHVPPDSGAASIIHNDYRLDNAVVDPADLRRIRAVLDWEMCTVGDPLMDLGNTLAYWIQADDPEPMRALRVQLSSAPGMMSRREVVEHYRARSGRTISHMEFHYAFGLFRLAAIMQQIYQRWRLGKASNPRFAGFGESVKTLLEASQRAVDHPSL